MKSLKKILVTGGSGFIGSNLVNFLVKKDFKIYNIDKLSYASTPEKYKYKSSNYFFKKIDIKYKNYIRSYLNFIRPDYIIHLASESHVDRSIDDPFTFIKNNIDLNISLYSSILDLNKKCNFNPKILHISTDEVYGSDKKKTFKENDAYNPTSPYSASKAGGDFIAKSFHHTFGLQVSVLRFCNNYGPFQFIEKFIPTVILKILDNKKIPIYATGKNVREWIYVDDTCKSIFEIMKNFKSGEDYNVGSNYRVSNLELVNNIMDIMNLKNKKKYINFVKDRPAHDFRYALDSKKISKNLSWKASISLHSGLKKTINWYQVNYPWLNDMLKRYKGERLGLKK
jgi:dTDP-glucose 4,6-dehydratase